MDEWENELYDEFEQDGEESEQFHKTLAIEREETLAFEIELDNKQSVVFESPVKKKLKRELEQEALFRLESAARTTSDFENIIAWWDRLDSNRERRERYHEISRSGDVLPIDYGAKEDGLNFPNTMNDVLEKQRQKGEFLDTIFDCPYEIHELVTERYMFKALYELSNDHKEVLYFFAVRLYSSKKIGEIRGQTDRNIRKVRNTMLKRVYKKILPCLKEKERLNLSMTAEERKFIAKMTEY